MWSHYSPTVATLSPYMPPSAAIHALKLPPSLSSAPSAGSVATLLGPVAEAERVGSVDTLRGVALLGILVMNIVSMALPPASYMNPMAPNAVPYAGAFDGANQLFWWVQAIVFDGKMMSIFSMLFGAGLVLMNSRAEAKARATAAAGGPAPRSFASIHYRRCAVLLFIGMAHAYGLWYGDILVAYAVCGMLLYPARNARPGMLLVLALTVLFVGQLIGTAMGGGLYWMRSAAEAAQKALDAGQTLSTQQNELLTQWQATLADFSPSVEYIEKQVAAFRGPWSSSAAANAHESLAMQAFILPLFMLWEGTGRMLLGMALMKWGVFGAMRSTAFYVKLTAISYAIGFPLVAIGATRLVEHQFDPAWMFLTDWKFNAVGGILVAIGHACIVMLILRAGALQFLTTRLAAVGRMALTNYLMQSLIGTGIFFGWGLGYFGYFERAQLIWFVLCIWVLQLLLSPVWLKHFKFGPAEWLWRSLTHLRPQPMRRPPHPPGQPVALAGD